MFMSEFQSQEAYETNEACLWPRMISYVTKNVLHLLNIIEITFIFCVILI